MEGRSWALALLLLLAACVDEPKAAPAAASPAASKEGALQVATLPPPAELDCPGGVCPNTSLLFDVNDPYRQRRVVRGSTRLAENAHSRSDCPAPAPDLVYDLHLRAAT